MLLLLLLLLVVVVVVVIVFYYKHIIIILLLLRGPDAAVRDELRRARAPGARPEIVLLSIVLEAPIPRERFGDKTSLYVINV